MILLANYKVKATYTAEFSLAQAEFLRKNMGFTVPLNWGLLV